MGETAGEREDGRIGGLRNKREELEERIRMKRMRKRRKRKGGIYYSGLDAVLCVVI